VIEQPSAKSCTAANSSTVIQSDARQREEVHYERGGRAERRGTADPKKHIAALSAVDQRDARSVASGQRAHVFPDHGFVEAECRDEEPANPEALANEIPFSFSIHAGDVDSAFASVPCRTLPQDAVGSARATSSSCIWERTRRGICTPTWCDLSFHTRPSMESLSCALAAHDSDFRRWTSNAQLGYSWKCQTQSRGISLGY